MQLEMAFVLFVTAMWMVVVEILPAHVQQAITARLQQQTVQPARKVPINLQLGMAPNLPNVRLAPLGKRLLERLLPLLRLVLSALLVMKVMHQVVVAAQLV